MEETQSNESQTMSILKVEKERWNEPKYRALYTDLLKKHRGVVGGSQDRPGRNPQDYAQETAILRNAMRSEREAMLYGFGAGILAFVSMRYLPKQFIKRFGGEAKVKALREAEEQAKSSGVGAIKNATALLIESSFAVFVGTRGYHLASSYKEDTFESLSKIPLCKGRSEVSDALCNEWIDLTRNKVPREFWQNLDMDKGLHDVQTWRAIQSFTKNCVKRRVYESLVRKERGIVDENEPVVLPNNVPPDLSEEQAQLLSTDR